MPKVSINILTKNRPESFNRARESTNKQTYKDFERIIIDDATSAENAKLINWFTDDKVISQPESKGITFNRQLALEKSSGEYIAILDDDDEWLDKDKLKKQVEFLDQHPDYVLVGGGIISDFEKFRPETDEGIRNSMLIRNNFFTSTVMFRRQQAIEAGGFVKDQDDIVEDYDLWLRMGNLGKMYNFQQVFTKYRLPNYNKERFKAFLRKQLRLIQGQKSRYPNFWLASALIKLRLLF